MSTKDKKDIKTELKEYRVLLKLLEKTQRRDLAFHLYTSVILHGINPLFPRRRWHKWPLNVDLVPDPRTHKKYSDNKSLNFDDEILENEIFDKIRAKKKLKIMKNDPGLYVNTDDSLEYIEDFVDDKSEREEVLEDENTHIIESQQQSYTDLSESEFEDGHETQQQQAYNSSSDSEYDSDSNPNDGKAVKHYTPGQLEFRRKKSDYKVDLFLEMKALIQRTIQRKINDMNLPANHGPSPEIEHECIDELARNLCTKYDKILQELHKNIIHLPERLKSNNLLSWQDILLADLKLFDDSTELLENKKQFYDKLEKLFVVPAYNFKYLPEISNETFEWKDYLKLQGQFQLTLLKAKVQEKKSVDFKRKIFQSKYDHKKSLIETSANKGIIKGPRRHTLDPKKIKDIMIKHGGLRVTDSTYKFTFQN